MVTNGMSISFMASFALCPQARITSGLSSLILDMTYVGSGGKFDVAVIPTSGLALMIWILTLSGKACLRRRPVWQFWKEGLS